MKNTIRHLLILVSLLTMLSAPVYAASFATTNDQLFSACDKNITNAQAANSPICKDKDTTTNPVNQKIKVASDIVAIVTGVAAVVLIVISGLKFITAGGAAPGQRSGDPNAIKSARATLTAAIVGLIIIALAWTMIAFVTDKLLK